MASHQPEPTVIPFRTSGTFERRLRREGALIECRCIRCGFRFIGSVSHKLPIMEDIHAHECSQKKPQGSVSSASVSRTLKVRKAHA